MYKRTHLPTTTSTTAPNITMGTTMWWNQSDSAPNNATHTHTHKTCTTISLWLLTLFLFTGGWKMPNEQSETRKQGSHTRSEDAMTQKWKREESGKRESRCELVTGCAHDYAWNRWKNEWKFQPKKLSRMTMQHKHTHTTQITNKMNSKTLVLSLIPLTHSQHWSQH